MQANSAVAVAVISKLPRLGRSKTRLARTVGAEAALALHRAFLADELEQLQRPEQWDLYLIHDAPADPAEVDELAALLGARARGLVPGQAGLSQELLRSFELLLASHPKAVIVSGDVPQLGPELVEQAIDALDGADVVLGPGPDGGYYLVGMTRPHDICTTIPMGTAAVERATVAQAQRLGLRVAHVAVLTDVDEAQDLLALERAPGGVAVRTRAVIDRLERDEVAAQLPSELQVEVTSRCNLRCSACLISYEDLDAAADLNMDQWRRIVGDLPRLQRVAFQLNGEPLLNPHVFEMIADARRRGAHTVMNTNGTLLDRQRSEAVVASGLHELRISLDGARAETVVKMACADILAKVERGVSEAVRARGSGPGPRLSLWMVATRLNIHELPELVQLAADWGVDEVYAQRLVLTGHGTARAEYSVHGRNSALLHDAVAKAEAVAAKTGVALRASGRVPILQSFAAASDPHPQRACYRPWRSAVVTASMRVLPCCIGSFTASYDELELGNLATQTWHEIYNGERYRALRRGILQRGPLRPECRDCGRLWSL
ncbi:MAG: DUF2064 domain-containing protein [Deltaproteobacteria bacterium]|nr:DUF2064 domain-containing protein [Deltaproteobacteria bacterium]